MDKKGRISSLSIAMNVIGFFLVIVGGGLIRFAKEETIAILGGFVLAGGVAILSLARYISK